jgi:hypothetical protein
MSAQHWKGTYISISTAVWQTGLSRYELYQCMARGLVVQPLTDEDLFELRRIRRLQELGVNLAGIEIILQMRQRIQALQEELDRRERAWGGPARVARRDPWQRLLPWGPDGAE